MVDTRAERPIYRWIPRDHGNHAPTIEKALRYHAPQPLGAADYDCTDRWGQGSEPCVKDATCRTSLRK
jgi:hypothetical protein